MYTDKLADIVHKYKNTNNRTIKMKPAHVKSSAHIDFDIENNDKNPKFKVADHVRISIYQNIFAKGYAPNWSEEGFITKNV